MIVRCTLKTEFDVMLKRIANRISNDYGKHPDEKANFVTSYTLVLPNLVDHADMIINTSSYGVNSICDKLISFL